MALDPSHLNWIPEELLVLVTKKLPLRSRIALACVSHQHHTTIKRWRDKTYGPIWFTEEQEELVRRILQRPSGLLHVQAPPSTGKTSVALAGALGDGGFVPGGDLLFIAVASGLIGVWTTEIKRMFPTKKILKVCSDVSHTEAIKRCTRVSLATRKYDIVIAAPVWILRYLSHHNLSKSVDTDDNVTIKWLIIDEAHRTNTTKAMIINIEIGKFPKLQYVLLLSANSVKREYDNAEEDEEHIYNMRRTEISNLPQYSVPESIAHYHDASWEADIRLCSLQENLEDFITERARMLVVSAKINVSNRHRSITEMLMRLVVFCAKKSILNNKPDHRILCFVPSAVAIPLKVVKSLPHILNYTIFPARGGHQTISTVEDFNNSTDKSILFMTYKGGATGFSVDADEVFLLDSCQSTISYTYQACKRIQRVTNYRKVIHAHYVADDIITGRFSHYSSELDAKGVKFIKNIWLKDGYDIIVKRFVAMNISPEDCPVPEFLFLCSPTGAKSKTPAGEYVRNNIPRDTYKMWCNM